MPAVPCGRILHALLQTLAPPGPCIGWSPTPWAPVGPYCFISRGPCKDRGPFLSRPPGPQSEPRETSGPLSPHMGAVGRGYSLFKIFIYFWLHWVLVAVHVLFVAACRLLSRYDAGVTDRVGSVVAAHGLSCTAACGILVPRPGIEPVSPALEGGFFTTAPPGKSQVVILIFLCPSPKTGLRLWLLYPQAFTKQKLKQSKRKKRACMLLTQKPNSLGFRYSWYSCTGTPLGSHIHVAFSSRFLRSCWLISTV